MAEKQTQHSEFQPSEAVGIRMAVIEWRLTDGHEWFIHSVYDDLREVDGKCLARRCRKLANRSIDCEFRWRYGFLKLDPSDKCVIFRPKRNGKEDKTI